MNVNKTFHVNENNDDLIFDGNTLYSTKLSKNIITGITDVVVENYEGNSFIFTTDKELKSKFFYFRDDITDNGDYRQVDLPKQYKCSYFYNGDIKAVVLIDRKDNQAKPYMYLTTKILFVDTKNGLYAYSYSTNKYGNQPGMFFQMVIMLEFLQFIWLVMLIVIVLLYLEMVIYILV